MNIKLHKNIFFDIFTVFMDVFLSLFSIFLSYKIINIFKPVDPIYYVSAIVGILTNIFMFFTYEFYTKMIRRKYEILLSVVISVIVSTITVMSTEFIFRNFLLTSSSFYFVITPVIMCVLLTFWKLLLLKFITHVEGAAKLLVIESKDVESSLARKVKYSYLELYQSWYIQIDTNDYDEIADTINKLDEYESIFISPNIPEAVRTVLINQAISKQKELYLLPDLYSISIMKNETVQFEDTPALRIKPFGLTRLQRVCKRGLDIFVSLIGIILTSPIMIISAIAIFMDSKGPIIYRQVRTTYMQKKFNIYKFRTMTADAERDTGAILATDDDPRITKVGKVLRSLRLDELPQFFNILRGDMTIVGPRPERPIFINDFLNDIPNYDKRFFVKAGLTGLAQVYARYDTTPADKTLYDLLYIKDYSFWLDIKLILLTIRTMFIKESSDGVHTHNEYEHHQNEHEHTLNEHEHTLNEHERTLNEHEHTHNE